MFGRSRSARVRKNPPPWLIDFASGLSQGLYGKIERVTSKVFLLSPAHVVVSGETGDADGDVDASFFTHA